MQISVPPLFLSSANRSIFCQGSKVWQRFDPWLLTWQEVAEVPADIQPIAPQSAVSWLNHHSATRRLPVGVIGPRNASTQEYQNAEALGQRLADLGLTVICGGRSGAMEGVCKGHLAHGGQPIGILPEEEWTSANDFVAIPIATGIGEARNAIIACASFALVAIGGGYGTLSEIALGLRLGRPVITLPDSFDVAGAWRCATVEEAVEAIALSYLKLFEPPTI